MTPDHLKEYPAYQKLLRVFEEVKWERDYQDKKWGGPDHDDTAETNESMCGYIQEYLDGTSGRAARHDLRTRLVKVAALAVATIERIDRRDAH